MIPALSVGLFVGILVGMLIENQFDLFKDPERKRKTK